MLLLRYWGEFPWQTVILLRSHRIGLGRFEEAGSLS